jgi:PAS domain S-box-containing protein
MVDVRELDAAEPGEPAAYCNGVQRPAESAVLEDLLQSADLQQFFDLFCALINIPVAVIDVRANTLISTRSQRICTMFHRVHPLTCSRCMESDRYLANQVEEGKIHAVHQCGNGLNDCASPIVIDGKHVANLFIGPFLTEPPDEDRFRKQAKELGFDESDYLAALHEVPVVAEEKIAAIIDVLVRMTGRVTNLALDRKRALESQSRQSIILDTIPQSVFWKDVEGRYLGCNTAFAKAAGLTPEEVIGKTDFDLPWPRGEAEAYRADDLAVISQKQARLHILESVRQADGSRLLVDTSKVPLMDALGDSAIGVLGIYDDVTERMRTEQELDQYRRSLEEMVESRTRELNLKNQQLADEVRERSLAQAAS